ncbi:helix-turn-helix transcriptional regulator [Kribbella sp. NPDC005582]|uniref:helix-turn-helix domain-containing protein n=1 Tax=Kribbella sp. NPDC005582 TaxID=3156893 RepID=UPI0033ABA721
MAEAMRAVRESADLSLEQLAEMTHYSPSALSRATRGKTLPSKRLMLEFVKACGAPNLEMWEVIWHEAKQADKRYRKSLDRPGEPTDAPNAAADVRPSRTGSGQGDQQEIQVYAPTISMLLQQAETPEDLVQAVRALGQRANRTSLRKMAEVSSVKKSTIQDWLTGKSRPTRLDDLIIGLGATASEQRNFAQCMERVWSRSKPVLMPAPAGLVYSQELSEKYGKHCFLLTVGLYDRNLVSGMVQARRRPAGVLGISVSPFHGMGAKDVAAIPSLRRRSTFSIGIWIDDLNAAAGVNMALDIMMTTSEGERPWYERLRVQLPLGPRFTARAEQQAAVLRRSIPPDLHRDDKALPKSTYPGVTVVRRFEAQPPPPTGEKRAKHRRPRRNILRKLFPGGG